MLTFSYNNYYKFLKKEIEHNMNNSKNDSPSEYKYIKSTITLCLLL